MYAGENNKKNKKELMLFKIKKKLILLNFQFFTIL